MLSVHLILALTAISSPSIQRVERADELEPSLGLFANAPDPYEWALRKALIQECDVPKCQMLVIPSFSEEWCVSMRRDDAAPPEVWFRRMKRSLWGEVMDDLSGHDTKSEYSVDDDAMTQALSRSNVPVERSSAFIDSETADLLELVWWQMLGRARYPEQFLNGFDGSTYHFATWTRGPIRSGEIRSPHEGTRTRALVNLGEHMRDLVLAPAPARPALERKLQSEARELLDRIENESAPSSPR